MKIAVGLIPLLGVATAAWASSEQAWAQFDRDVARRCASASGLARPHVSAIVGFDDRVGKVAALVRGQEAIRRRGQTTLRSATKLCLYDKRTKQAWADDAEGWTAPNLR